MKKNVIIFCQAPAKLPYVLACYEKYRAAGCEVGIVVCAVRTIYDFLGSLNLDLKFLQLIPTEPFSLSHPLRLIETKRHIDELLKQNEWGTQTGSLIFFTCISQDIYTHILLRRLSRGNEIRYLSNPVDILSSQTKKIDLKTRLMKGFLQLAFHVPLVCYRQEFLAIGVPGSLYLHEDAGDVLPVLRKYSYRPDWKSSSGKRVIVYANPYRDPYTTPESYVSAHVEAAKKLKSLGAYLIGKGHPRLGYLKELEPYVDEILPQYVPAEFLDLAGVELSVGLTTTSICDTAKKGIPSYSILPMVEILNSETLAYWQLYLKINSNSQIRYLESVKQLEELVP